MLQSVLLAHHLLQSPIPNAILEEAIREAKVTRVFNLVIDLLIKRYRFNDPTLTEIVRTNLFYLPSLRGDFSYKLNQPHNYTQTPLQDWSAVKLPDSLLPLHYVLRFPRWCLRKFAKL